MANYKGLACLLNSCYTDEKKRIAQARMVYLQIIRTSYSLAYRAPFALRKSPSQSSFVPRNISLYAQVQVFLTYTKLCHVMAPIVSRNISSVMQLCCVIISLIQCNFKKIWKFNKLQIRFG